MALQPHRAQRRSLSRSRKFSGKCEGCGKSICSCKAYQYVDGNNAAITNNSPYLCKECYEARYNVKIPGEADTYRNNLVAWLQRMREAPGLSPAKVEAMDMLVRVVQQKDLV